MFRVHSIGIFPTDMKAEATAVGVLHCVSKSDTEVAHYNFNAHQLILVIFGRNVVERICYRMVI